MTSKQFISRMLELGAELDKATAVVDCNRIHEEAEELHREYMGNYLIVGQNPIKVTDDDGELIGVQFDKPKKALEFNPPSMKNPSPEKFNEAMREWQLGNINESLIDFKPTTEDSYDGKDLGVYLEDEAPLFPKSNLKEFYRLSVKDLDVFDDPDLLTSMHDCSERIGCQSYDTDKCHKACNFYKKKK